MGTRYRGGRLEPNSFTGIKVCHFSPGTVCCNSNWCQNVRHFKLVLVYNISQLDQFLPACRQPEREPRCQIGLFIIQCFLIFNLHCQDIKRFILSSVRDNYRGPGGKLTTSADMRFLKVCRLKYIMRLPVIRSSASWHRQLKYSEASLIIMLSSIFCHILLDRNPTISSTDKDRYCGITHVINEKHWIGNHSDSTHFLVSRKVISW